MQVEDLEEVLDLARRHLPRLFPDRSGCHTGGGGKRAGELAIVAE